MKNKRWLIVYDIRDVRRLAKVEKCVSSYGWRVQKSVFEADADESVILSLKARLLDIIEPVDFVLFLPVCERDWQKRSPHGIGKNSAQTQCIQSEKFVIL